MSTEIKIRNEPNAEPEIIDLKDPTEAHRTLGTHQSPSGDMTTQAMVLRKKGRTYTAKFSTLKKMSKYKVWTAYKSMLRPALEYPLSTTTLSKRQIELYHRLMVRAILGALGINRRFPRTSCTLPNGITRDRNQPPVHSARHQTSNRNGASNATRERKWKAIQDRHRLCTTTRRHKQANPRTPLNRAATSERSLLQLCQKIPGGNRPKYSNTEHATTHTTTNERQRTHGRSDQEIQKIAQKDSRI